jgi:hypothetical protein
VPGNQARQAAQLDTVDKDLFLIEVTGASGQHCPKPGRKFLGIGSNDCPTLRANDKGSEQASDVIHLLIRISKNEKPNATPDRLRRLMSYTP